MMFAAMFTESAGRLVVQFSDDLGVNPTRVAIGGIVVVFVVSFFIALYLFAGAQARASRSLRSVAAGEPAPVLPAAAPPPAPAPGEHAPEPAELATEAATPAEPDKPPEKPAEQPAEKKPPAEELTAANAVERETLLRFFADGMKQPNMQAYVSDGKMAPHNRFGCHLYLLGAGRACLAASRSEPAALVPVLQSALELLGTDSERARSFISKEEEYARDPKYKGMIQVGFKAMDRFMAGAAGATAALAQALKAWNTADADDAQSDNIAIMFTDMVSSVETTQALGDQGMMKLVQTHNLIVGSVLKTHHGHQVKHTGDGIMAVFPKVIDGVAAASEIQRQIAEHNRVTASSFLKVRIGLASGTPIRDQDDYFGTVVQLAARLCPCAGEAEICVSEAIAEQVAPTKRFAFSEVREVKLKGFTQLQSMRFVLWQQARAAAPAA
jgi:adenylate cyclase